MAIYEIKLAKIAPQTEIKNTEDKTNLQKVSKMKKLLV